MSNFLNRRTSSLVPYVPGEQPADGRKVIKLNTNENPYPPSPMVLEALKSAVSGDLRLYPDPEAKALSAAVAERFGLETANVFVGNGSDEVLGFAFSAFYDEEKPVNAPDVTYSFYPVYASYFGVKYNSVPVKDGFELDIDALCEAEGGVCFANPNAPTSLAVSLSDIRKILEAHRDDVVIVDEAYIDFGSETAVPLIREFNNLLVVRTLSKSASLAGLRVGFALGSPELIDALNRVKNCFNSYTLDRLAIAGAAAAIKDQSYYDVINARIVETRELYAAKLRSIGFRVLQSGSNFLFITHGRLSAKDIFDHLYSKDILVRHFNKDRISNWLRVTVGTPEQMEAFYQEVERYLNERG